MEVCLVCNDLFYIFGAIMGWLHKLHIPSFTLHTSYCLLLLPDFVYLRSNAMCHKQPRRPKPSIHSKHKIAAVATPACSLPHQSPSIQNSPFRRRGAAECPAHSVLDLVSVWAPGAGFAVQLIVQRKAQITKSL